ncbi:hypothetical protein MS2017_0127 [Bathymodiolus thermophilus thioautotrophic gill symbiont]|uniref:Uncharacterized protein n=1 Tax=Bathymodiolus thermophilus thioautotrophic gill symbiont TaxID=2360 RepID=A0A3G3IJ62_9GAMM|nr:hypothetical protein [Bathymodiolus thermophilus thioautotrophic gill symbiont]AYQ55886.1 hypothetical protein MS2017_0127 [Bathymodiolus thermophilus thioautotrophic gill symbiont]
MRAVKLSILSLLLFGIFNAQVLAGECSRGAGRADILHSFYNKNTNPPSCTCISGYGDNGTIKRNIDGKFSGTCTLIEDSTSSSPASWAVPVAIIGATVVAGAVGAGYYFYKASATSVETPAVEIEMNTLGEEVRSIANDNIFQEVDDPEYASISDINMIRNNYDPAGTPSDPDLIDGIYSVQKPIDELPIESNYSEPWDKRPFPPENEAAGDEPAYATVNKNRNKEWSAQDPDEEINLDKFSEQVKDVQENVLEEGRLSEASGGEELKIDGLFEEQAVSDPGIPFEANVIIKDPAYEDIDKWNKEKTLEDSDPEECG